MFQPELIHESSQDALRDAVKALGGAKTVGHMLRPTVPIDQAKNWCNDCLSPERRAKFDLDDVITILRKAREAGFHGAMAYIACECGYTTPTPAEPEEENAKLQRQFIAAVEEQRKILARMERMNTIAPATLRQVG